MHHTKFDSLPITPITPINKYPNKPNSKIFKKKEKKNPIRIKEKEYDSINNEQTNFHKP